KWAVQGRPVKYDNASPTRGFVQYGPEEKSCSAFDSRAAFSPAPMAGKIHPVYKSGMVRADRIKRRNFPLTPGGLLSSAAVSMAPIPPASCGLRLRADLSQR